MGPLEKLLGQRVKTITKYNKPKLTPKEILSKDIEDQIKLLGNNPPTVRRKVDGEMKSVPIKSWFTDNNQFKPTPSNITFFGDGKNAYDIGDNKKEDILNAFKEGFEGGSYKTEFDDWLKRVEQRNSNISLGKKKSQS
jgi:hypothetical protein